MPHPLPATSIWRNLLLLIALAGLLVSCERIEPVRQAPELGAESVVLTCEGCHTTRAFLRRLAIDDGSGGGGGGG
jgi:hypothetical protein